MVALLLCQPDGGNTSPVLRERKRENSNQEGLTRMGGRVLRGVQLREEVLVLSRAKLTLKIDWKRRSRGKEGKGGLCPWVSKNKFETIYFYDKINHELKAGPSASSGR